MRTQQTILVVDDEPTIREVVRKYLEVVQIDVHNSGAPIAPDDLPHLFERFYRGGDGQAHSGHGRRGSGLGLAIARGLVEAHGGRIWAESDEEAGTTFSFVIPRHGPAASVWGVTCYALATGPNHRRQQDG